MPLLRSPDCPVADSSAHSFNGSLRIVQPDQPTVANHVGIDDSDELSPPRHANRFRSAPRRHDSSCPRPFVSTVGLPSRATRRRFNGSSSATSRHHLAPLGSVAAFSTGFSVSPSTALGPAHVRVCALCSCPRLSRRCSVLGATADADKLRCRCFVVAITSSRNCVPRRARPNFRGRTSWVCLRPPLRHRRNPRGRL